MTHEDFIKLVCTIGKAMLRHFSYSWKMLNYTFAHLHDKDKHYVIHEHYMILMLHVRAHSPTHSKQPIEDLQEDPHLFEPLMRTKTFINPIKATRWRFVGGSSLISFYFRFQILIVSLWHNDCISNFCCAFLYII